MIEVRNEVDFTEYLDTFLNSVETDDLEFKSAAGGFPGSFWDTYSAFANSEGGTIILGVAEKKGKFFLDSLLVLNAACTDGYVTNESLRVILNIHKGEIADLLKEMCNKHLLKSKGYGRGTRYYLASENNIPSSNANIPSSDANIPSSNANIPSSKNNKNASIKQRMPFCELKKEICLACSDWISLDELSLKVKRNKTYLKIYIIPRLLEDKSIEMMFPGVPKHPRQKYKIKK